MCIVRVNAAVNYGLWVIMLQCKPMARNQRTTLVGMLTVEAAVHLWEQCLHRSLYFPLNFVVTLKTSLEKKKKPNKKCILH